VGRFARVYRRVVETDLIKDPASNEAGSLCLCLFFETILEPHDQTDQDE